MIVYILNEENREIFVNWLGINTHVLEENLNLEDMYLWFFTLKYAEQNKLL